MSTSDKLLYLQGTKSAIKDAIIAKGVSVETGTPFRDYAIKIGEISGGGGTPTPVADEWVRPTEWLALPDNVDGVQKVSILNAVFDTDSEFVAFQCQGAYTVDWGDGVIENFATGVKAEHKYTYSNSALNSDTVVNFGYKQCVITITPQASYDLTTVDLNSYHSSIGNATLYDLISGFLDIRINSLSCSSLTIGKGAPDSYIKHAMLEQCLIGELVATSLAELFYDCYSLQSVSIKDTSNIMSFNLMHNANYSLKKMPIYTFRAAGANVGSMFNFCYSLVETYPIAVNIADSNDIVGMFANCRALTYISLSINSNINYSLVNVFTSCMSLETIKLTLTGSGKVTSLSGTFISTRIKSSPVIDTSLCTSFNNTFQLCSKLIDLYIYDYSSATSLAGMLNGCYSLKDAGYFNTTASCTNLSNMCSDCPSLEKAPTFANSAGVTNISSMLGSCLSLKNIPNYVFGNVVLLTNFASTCHSLQVMPNIYIGSSYTANTNFTLNLYSLKRMLMPLRFTFSVANAKMSAGALNEMYTILLPAVANQTVTVTGNYGATSNPVVLLSGTTTAGSKTVTMTNTTNLSVGMFVSGIPTALTSDVRCTFTASGDLVTAAGHCLIDGDIVSLRIVNGTTGIYTNTIYYVVNATTNTFQLSLTQGGSVIDLVTDGTGGYISPVFITAITPNVSIEVSLPMRYNGTTSLAFRSNDHKTYLATMKGWTVTG